MLSISTGRLGSSAWIDARTSIPLRSLSETSRITMSKGCRRSAGRTSSALETSSATIQFARSAMICCSPRRTMPWSSAMRIFIGYPDEDPRSPAVGALDRNMAVKGVDTLADTNQSKSIGAAQLLVADSAPEIAHLGLDESFALLDAHLDA